MPTDHSKLKVIYHHPRPITENGLSGSQVRPYKMLKAFQELGATVIEVTGDARTRSEIMQHTRLRIRNGERFDFVYSENLTIPFAMSEAHRLPLHPLLDHSFLAFCNRHGVPVSMFNRDVYWRDKSYREMLPWWGRMVTIPLYWYDWWQHTRYLDTLYLPSAAMGTVLPWMNRFPNVRYLPPGAEISDTDNVPQCAGALKLFYVGGIEPPTYDLRPLLAAIQKTKAHTSLTICCRKKEWNRVSELYRPFITDRIDVVHCSGKELDSLYAVSDLFAVVRSQGSYLDFSVPIKIYESIGFGLPILCTSGGETARIVESEGLGWVRKIEDVAEFLQGLAEQPELIKAKRAELMELRDKHTWKNRAIQVCHDMARPRHISSKALNR
ncbi:glycosyltransferase [Marinobacter panjinensis]|nr:glycosyltransferase [Marinobacter panjinensis]MCR8913684.1 glycosyltransferase [Marinobacter panjinensis]